MTATTRSARLPYVPALDGLRGVAIAAVLAHHAGHLTGGWLGVDLFFVLSGYLITALLLVDWRADGAIGLRTFWARRVRRLGPALVVTLVGVGVYAATIATPSELRAIRLDGLATLLEVANWRTIAVGGDYWATALRPSPLRHTWSLAIEEQLYVVWPLVVVGVLAWRRRPRAVLVTALVLAAASAAAMVGLHALGTSRARLYYGTDTRAVAVLLGAALAAGRATMGAQAWRSTWPARQVVGVVAAGGLALAWWQLDGASALPYQGVLPLAGLAGAVVIASVADRHHPGPIGGVLTIAPLIWLGRVSYGAYLYHWPLYLVIDEARTGLGGWALTAARVAATLAVAAASHRYVEQPIRTGRLLAGRQGRAAVPGGAALAVLALFAGTLGATGVDVDARRVSGQVDRSSVPGAPTVLVAGDSIPLLLGVALTDQRDELGVSVVNRASPGCHLLADLGSIRGTEGNVRDDVADCSADGRYRSDVADLAPDVSLVLFGEFPNQAVELDGRWAMPCETRYLAALRGRLAQLVADLRSGGAPVVLVTAPGTSLSWVLEGVPAGMAERVACTNALLDELAAADDAVSVIDLASFVCPEPTRCLTERDGVDLRPDGLHFQGEGAELVNRWLIPQVVAATGEG